jgi:hypothetical protein
VSRNKKWKHWRQEFWRARLAYQTLLKKHDALVMAYNRLRKERGGYFWRLLCALFGR